MGRLTMATGRLPVGKPRLRTLMDGGAAGRDAIVVWRAWYKTKRWQQLRWGTLLRGGFKCVMCGLVAAEKGALVADHIRPHRGDPALFWDAGNLQVLCTPCHASAKQKAERGRR